MGVKGKIRVLIAKCGLDGHDRGAKVIARTFRDAGMEVVYTGLHQTAEQVVSAAIQEDVQVIGLSILSGSHMSICEKMMECLEKAGIREDRIVIVGGTILDEDIPVLKDMGVREVFPPGSPIDAGVEYVSDLFRDREG